MTVDDVARWAGSPLPAAYRALLPTFRDAIVGESVLLYRPEVVIERNETFEVRKYLPGHLAVGDDSGGRVALIALDDPECRASLVDVGSLEPADFEPLGVGLAGWVAAGCPLP